MYSKTNIQLSEGLPERAVQEINRWSRKNDRIIMSKKELNTPLKPNKKIRFVLAEENPWILTAARMWLRSEQKLNICLTKVLSEECSEEDAISIVKDFPPNLVIVDISLPTLLNHVKEAPSSDIQAKAEVITLAVQIDKDFILEQLQDNSNSLSYELPSEVVTAVRESYLYYKQVSKSNNRSNDSKLGDSYSESSMLVQLTPRELTVLKSVAKGLSNQEIAINESFSVRTIKATLTSIYLKLAVTSRTEAVIKGLKLGILDLSDI